jgi:S1-C subfamily serine protease
MARVSFYQKTATFLQPIMLSRRRTVSDIHKRGAPFRKNRSFDLANDIAILKAEVIKSTAIPVQTSRRVLVGDEVFTLGFPNIQFQGIEAKYTHGHINSLTGMSNDPRMFQISAAVQPGNSGGPLLNIEGLVVGMVVAKLDEMATVRETGSLPQKC